MWLTTDEFNFLNALQPLDVNANTTCFPCRAVNMAKYDSMVAIVSMGQGSTNVIWVNTASTATITPGSAGRVIPCNYRVGGQATTASTCDLLAARTAYATTGLSVSATTTPNVNYYLEIKSADVLATTDGYPYVAISVSTAAQANLLSVNYIMKPRYPQNTMMPAAT